MPILILDKDPVTNSALEVLLQDDQRLSVAGNARNEEEAAQILSERNVEVVLMDIDVNNKTFHRPLQRLKRRFPKQKTLALLYEEAEVIEGVLKSGAEGYFLKESDLGELADAILQLAHTGRFRPSALQQEYPDPQGILSFQRREQGI